MTSAPSPFFTPCEVLDSAALDLAELAHACRQPKEWVVQRVREDVLQIDTDAGTGNAGWRFSSRMLLRARRIAHLEDAYDADPQLAALAADLMEEVAALRQLLGQRGAHSP